MKWICMYSRSNGRVSEGRNQRALPRPTGPCSVTLALDFGLGALVPSLRLVLRRRVSYAARILLREVVHEVQAHDGLVKGIEQSPIGHAKKAFDAFESKRQEIFRPSIQATSWNK